MKLGDKEFGNVWDASGLRNFDGSGWWYHWLLRLIGLNFFGSTFVAKTTTTYQQAGNMPLKADGKTPLQLFPRCIYVSLRSWLRGCALNALGLSGPGVEFILRAGWWQALTKPFFISWMPVRATQAERLGEVREFVRLIKRYRHTFQADYGVQFNVSCPNVGAKKKDPDVFVAESVELLEVLGELGVPIMVKFSVTTDVATAKRIADHYLCDAVCVSNTVPYGELPDKIDWVDLFGSLVSPLVKRLGEGKAGGLSGAPIYPLVLEWVKAAKRVGFTKPINAGGGILCQDDARRLIQAGADSIFIGSVAFLRPWRVRGIIQYANRYYAMLRDSERVTVNAA